MGRLVGRRRVAGATYTTEMITEQLSRRMKAWRSDTTVFASGRGLCFSTASLPPEGADVSYQETSAEGLPGRQWGEGGGGDG